MSDEAFFTDPGFGEFIVSANGYYDHEAGLWWKPWTNKPDRAVIGYIGVLHPDDIAVMYSYLIVDLELGVLSWHHGATGSPETDPVVARLPYRGVG